MRNVFLIFQMVNVCWWYYFSKFTEFFDTVRIQFINNLAEWSKPDATLNFLHSGFRIRNNFDIILL